MVSNKLIKEVIRLIEEEKERLGSYRKVAVKCYVSPSMVNNMRAMRTDLIREDNWQKVASALGYKEYEWQIAETTNLKRVIQICEDARRDKLWTAVSHSAGSGKTSAIKYVAKNYTHTYSLQCGEWAKHDFAVNLARTLGIQRYSSCKPNSIMEDVITFFVERADESSLLILDEADKLSHAALRLLIALFNGTEDILALVMFGTENLEKEIKTGVRLAKKGYDEIDSRFGRNFIHLIGSSRQDIAAICIANGITNKAAHYDIFKESNPVSKVVPTANGQRAVQVVEDLRRVKKIVKREKMKLEKLKTDKSNEQHSRIKD